MRHLYCKLDTMQKLGKFGTLSRPGNHRRNNFIRNLFQNKYLEIFGPGTFNLQNIRYFSRRHYVRFTDDFYFSKMTLSSQLNNILNRENVLKLFSSKKIKKILKCYIPPRFLKYRQRHKLKNY